MLEVNARAERLDYANAQMAAARAELRALDNQLVIVSNQLVTTQQDNAQISEAAATRWAAAQLASLHGRACAPARLAVEVREEVDTKQAEAV